MTSVLELRDEDSALRLFPESVVSQTDNDSSLNSRVYHWIKDADVEHLDMQTIHEIDRSSTIFECRNRNSYDNLWRDTQEHTLDMYKVLMYLYKTGTHLDYPGDMIFMFVPDVVEGACYYKDKSMLTPLSLETIGEVRSVAALFEYIMSVTRRHDTIEGSVSSGFMKGAETTGFRVKNPMLHEYLMAHPESAVVLADFVKENSLGSSDIDTSYAIRWCEDTRSARALSSGYL